MAQIYSITVCTTLLIGRARDWQFHFLDEGLVVFSKRLQRRLGFHLHDLVAAGLQAAKQRRQCVRRVSKAIKTLVEKAGGKLVTAYMTTGTNDVVLVTELPDGLDAVAVGMAAAASGAVSKIETVRAWTLGEFKGIAEKAARVATSYVPPGR